MRIDGDLIIPAGVTLRLLPGASLSFASGPIWFVAESRAWRGAPRSVHVLDKCAIVVYGRLIAESTALSPISIGSGHDWGGVHFLEGSRGVLKGVHLQNSVAEAVALWDSSQVELEGLRIERGWAGVGVYGKSRLRMNGSSVSGMRESGILCEGAEAVIEDTAIAQSAVAAIHMSLGARLEARRCRLSQGLSGIIVAQGRLSVTQCDLSGNKDIAIELRGGGHRLDRVAIRDGARGLILEGGSASAVDLSSACARQGVSIRSGGRLDWRGGGTEGGEIGILVESGRLEVSDVACARAHQGVRLETGELTGRGLRLSGNRDIGLALYGASRAQLAGCALEDNPLGILVNQGLLRLSESLNRCAHDLHLENGARVWRDGVLSLAPGDRDPGSPGSALLGAVLLTRRLGPFRRLYRSIYSLAVRRLQKWATSDPRILTALVHRGWVNGDWEPGISDLDFVLSAEPLDGAGGRAWLDNFWQTYDGWKDVFPFLGEALVATPADLACYLRLGGIRSREIRVQNRVLAGAGLPPEVLPLEKATPLEALGECAHAFTRLMEWGLFPRKTHRTVISTQVSKSIIDILRYQRAATADAGGETLVPTRTVFMAAGDDPELADWRKRLSSIPQDAAPLCAESLRGFHRAARDTLEGRLQKTSSSPRETVQWSAATPKFFSPSEAIKDRGERTLSGLKDCFGEALNAVVLDDLYRSYIILEDAPVESSGLTEILQRWIRRRGSVMPGGTLPIILSRSLWEIWRRLPYLENPVMFLDFPSAAAESRSWTPAGSWFPGCAQFRWSRAPASAAPQDRVVRRVALESAANLRLTWRLWGSSKPTASTAHVLHYLFSRALGLRLLLEKGIGVSFFDLDDILRLSLDHFPDQREALSRLKAPDLLQPPQRAFFERYEFFDKQISRLGAD